VQAGQATCPKSPAPGTRVPAPPLPPAPPTPHARGRAASASPRSAWKHAGLRLPRSCSELRSLGGGRRGASEGRGAQGGTAGRGRRTPRCRAGVPAPRGQGQDPALRPPSSPLLRTEREEPPSPREHPGAEEKQQAGQGSQAAGDGSMLCGKRRLGSSPRDEPCSPEPSTVPTRGHTRQD